MTTTTHHLTETATTPPSLKRLDGVKILALLLIACGIAITGYLSLTKLSGAPVACLSDGAFDCGVVENSIYAEIMGIPTALLGMGAYLIIGGLLLIGDRLPGLGEYHALLLVCVTLVAWVFSMWLVYVQVGILQALCIWCLTHEAIITVLLGLIGFRWLRSLK